MVTLRADTYLYDTNSVSRETGLECKDETRTQQHFKDEVDINTIVKRFGLTGQLPENVRVPLQVDFEDIFDFQTAMNVVRAGEEAFMTMPADVRARFGNDPARFLSFVQDPANTDEAVKLGVAIKRSEEGKVVPKEASDKGPAEGGT